jgi:hypothetical protein
VRSFSSETGYVPLEIYVRLSRFSEAPPSE